MPREVSLADQSRGSSCSAGGETRQVLLVARDLGNVERVASLSLWIGNTRDIGGIFKGTQLQDPFRYLDSDAIDSVGTLDLAEQDWVRFVKCAYSQEQNGVKLHERTTRF